MKKIGLIIVLLIGFAACQTVAENTYKVTVNAEGAEDGKQVFLQKPQIGMPPKVLDTMVFKNGAVEFTGTAESPELHYLLFDGTRGILPVILEEGNITVTAHIDSLNTSKIGGTPSNDDFTAFIDGTDGIREKMASIQKQGMEAQQKGDTLTMSTLTETFKEVQQEAREYEQNFVKTHPNSYVSLMVIQQMANSPNSDKAAELFDGLAEELKNTEIGKALTKQFNEVKKLSVGSIAPDFSAPTPEGDTISLKSSLGKVTILDFWAAWCKPCRVENPNLVKIYDEFHKKGLSVVGVSLDRKAEDWKKAIEEDQLPWHHMSNLKFWQDPIAQLYNIKSIPATYILDAEGKIIAKNLRGEELYEKIATLLP
jgi:peroxiredoxin